MPVKDEILVPQNKDTSFDGDVLPGEDGRWNFGSLTKRWREVIAKVGRFINLVYTGNLKPVRDDVTYTSFTYVPLKEPYTHTSFDGDSFSTVGSNTKIENTGWSTTIPADAKAIVLRVDARDSGSASGNCWFGIYTESGGTSAAIMCRPYGRPNDARESEHQTVPCTDGDIWYQTTATGTNTLDVWLWCFGYYI